MSGTVVSIALAETQGGPTFDVDRVDAITGRGLQGDRIVNDANAAGADVPAHRQVTFIESEALAGLDREYGIALTATESRRNVCTRGVALNHLVGRVFRVGAARLRGVELCEPCKTLQQLTGKPGVLKGLIHRGGLRAEVVEGGTISVGDVVVADGTAD